MMTKFGGASLEPGCCTQAARENASVRIHLTANPAYQRECWPCQWPHTRDQGSRRHPAGWGLRPALEGARLWVKLGRSGLKARPPLELWLAFPSLQGIESDAWRGAVGVPGIQGRDRRGAILTGLSATWDARRILDVYLLVLVAVFFSAPPGEAAVETRVIDRYVRAEMELNAIPGLSLAIVKDAKVFYVQAYGTRNAASQQAMQVGTPSDLASVSKSLTALGILRMQHEGKIDLDSAVTAYLAELDGPSWERVTVRHLIRHRSGLRRRHDFLVPCCSQAGLDLVEAGRRLAGADLEGLGGATFSYANSNYVLLAAVLQELSGVPFPRYMRQNVFERLGMRQTAVIENQDRSPKDAFPHELQWGRVNISPSRFLGWYGSSRVKASAEDMGAYMVTLLRRGALPVEFGHGTWWASAGPEYDLGWNVSESTEWLDHDLVLEHSGSLWGADTAVVLVPGRGDGATVLINRGTGRAQHIARALAASLAGRPLPRALKSSRLESPDTWAQVFLLLATFLLAGSLWYGLRVRWQLRLAARRWNPSRGQVARAAILAGLAIALLFSVLASTQPPLAALPSPIQTALPLLAGSVSLLLVVAGVAGLAPMRRP